LSDRAKVLSALAIGSIAIGFAAIFFRLAAPTDPLLASMLRLGIAGTLLAPLSLRAMRDGSLSRRAMKVGAACGVVYAVHFGTWVASLERTSVAASVTLVTATPLMLAAIAFARGRDRPNARTMLAIAGAMVGVLIIAASDAAEAPPGAIVGDVLALLGAGAMVFYLLAVRELGDVPAFAFGGVAALSGAATLALALPIEPLLGVRLTWPTNEALLFIALAALIPQIVGHGLLTWALRRASPTEVGLATAAEPVISTALAVVVFAEQPTPLVMLGAAITLVAVVVGVASSRADRAAGKNA
jgi:drug/metabolite transporter (DMT)-like permease